MQNISKTNSNNLFVISNTTGIEEFIYLFNILSCGHLAALYQAIENP